MVWVAAGSGSVVSPGQLTSMVVSSTVHGTVFVLRGRAVENFELQLQTMCTETEDTRLKEKSQCFLNSVTAWAIICFSLLPALEFSWDVIRASVRTMLTLFCF